jgi:hypothetical protein
MLFVHSDAVSNAESSERAQAGRNSPFPKANVRSFAPKAGRDPCLKQTPPDIGPMAAKVPRASNRYRAVETGKL